MAAPAEATTEQLQARVDKLEEQVDDLASFVGRVTDATFGARFKECDRGNDVLTWKEVLTDEGTEDEALCGWWVYQVDAADEADDA